MRLAAIYFESSKEHFIPGKDLEYLFDKPQTINLGGKYFYEFGEKVEEKIPVTRELNKSFIPDFFNLDEKIKTKVTNLSAIVGQNGAGKSTILNLLKKHFNPDWYGESNSSVIVIIEKDENETVYTNSSDVKPKDFKVELIRKYDKRANIEQYPIQTIYYSPHFDFKYFGDVMELDPYDISNDATLFKDLYKLKVKTENMRLYYPSHELLLKNSIRQLKLLQSDLLPIINKVLELKDISKYEPILYFRRYEKPSVMGQISFSLIRPLQEIDEKAKEEKENYSKIKEEKGNLESWKHLLKTNIISRIISTLYQLLYGGKDHFYNVAIPLDAKEKIDNCPNAYQALLLFIKHCKIEDEKIFSNDYLKDLIEKIYSAIKHLNIEDERNIIEKSINQYFLRTTPANAIEIINLQSKFLNDFNQKYIKSNYDRIDGFVSYRPNSDLSSGETALLNLFSRIYGLFNISLETTHHIKPKEHYIVLLDEADLTFHPTWKKKYVKALLTALPHIFNSSPMFKDEKTKPTFQIIFTTHDPLSLSDLPNANVVYIERKNYESKANIMDYDNVDRPPKTFGANISDLLADSFFVEDSLIGDFAKDKINKVIDWLTDEDKKEDADGYYKVLIELIDEPIVQSKLNEMYKEKMPTRIRLKLIEEKINELKEEKKELKEEESKMKNNNAIPKSKK